MNTKKLISIYAKADLSDASKWYEKQKKGLGQRFLNEIKEAFEMICKIRKVFKYDMIIIAFITPRYFHTAFIINI
jgi:hypothetical protein